MLDSVKFMNTRKWLNIISVVCKTLFYHFCEKNPEFLFPLFW